jgi:hypothetical protein
MTLNTGVGCINVVEARRIHDICRRGSQRRGRVIESMHVAVSRNETHQNFNIWVYGDEKLVRGSGLFVGETGVAANHHFLTPRDGSGFRFTEGRYRLEVFAHLLGDKNKTKLFSQTLEISPETGAALAEPGAGLYFDWGPDSSRYLPHVEKRPPSPDPEDFLKLLGAPRPVGSTALRLATPLILRDLVRIFITGANISDVPPAAVLRHFCVILTRGVDSSRSWGSATGERKDT